MIIVFSIVAVIVLLAMVLIAWFGRKQLIEHPVTAFAVLCVAVIAGYVMWMGYLLTETLSGPNWCARALGAEKASPGQTVKGLEACIDLLKLQLGADKTNSHILFGGVVGSLLVLMVITIAGGRMAFRADKTGASGEIGRDEPPVVTPSTQVNVNTLPPTTPSAPPPAGQWPVDPPAPAPGTAPPE